METQQGAPPKLSSMIKYRCALLVTPMVIEGHPGSASCGPAVSLRRMIGWVLL